MIRTSFGVLALSILASASGLSAQGLKDPGSEFKDTASNKAWHATVERTERGYLIGNPDAEAHLIMFTSYGCEGCYEFAFKGDPELDIALLAPGLLSLEIRTRLNHPVDLPLALLASCGDHQKFKVNHSMFMRDQSRWGKVWHSASAFNRQHWTRDTQSARTSMVSALGFDDLMARRRGYSRMDLTRCLSDRGAISKLRANAAADDSEFDLPNGLQGHARPNFVLDGVPLKGVHDWDALYPILKQRFKPAPQSD